MKKFLFSIALALGALCIPGQASAAKLASPVVNNVKVTSSISKASAGDVIVIISDDGSVVIIDTAPES